MTNINDSNYGPAGLCDAVIAQLSLKNDAALARALEVSPPVISNVRSKRRPVGAVLIVRMIEAGIQLPTIRKFVPKVPA